MTDPAPHGQADLFDQWLAHRGPATTGAPTPAPAPAPEPVPEPEPAPVPAPSSAPPPASGPGRRRRDCPPDAPPLLPDAPTRRKPEQPDLPATVEEDLARPTFRPRTAARRSTGVLLLASATVTALLGWEAYEARAGLALEELVPLAVAAALTLVLWAVRSSTSVVRLTVDDGQLTISRAGDTWCCDLTAAPVEVVGTPGRRGWKVVFARRGRAPYVVDASVVDPVHFTRVLAHYRPDVTGPP